MSKEELIKTEGLVLEILPNSTYRVKLDTLDVVVLAYMSGKMRQNKIKIVAGDKVTVEMSPYDLTKGRLSYRHR